MHPGPTEGFRRNPRFNGGDQQKNLVRQGVKQRCDAGSHKNWPGRTNRKSTEGSKRLDGVSQKYPPWFNRWSQKVYPLRKRVSRGVPWFNGAFQKRVPPGAREDFKMCTLVQWRVSEDIPGATMLSQGQRKIAQGSPKCFKNTPLVPQRVSKG